jgi:Ca2+-binding EF-hand superfamily protein
MPEADIDSDHSLLFAKICTVLKKNIKSKTENQDAIWRSYMLYDRKGKML